uniref:DUF3592 domain-containing protein n=1 Tax=Caballeronia udeis TaxID=1232866 RepID=UPI0009ECEEEA
MTAYYDPENPERSVLEKRVARGIDKNILFMSLFVFCMSALIVGVLVYGKNRQLRKL